MYVCIPSTTQYKLLARSAGAPRRNGRTPKGRPRNFHVHSDVTMSGISHFPPRGVARNELIIFSISMSRRKLLKNHRKKLPDNSAREMFSFIPLINISHVMFEILPYRTWPREYSLNAQHIFIFPLIRYVITRNRVHYCPTPLFNSACKWTLDGYSRPCCIKSLLLQRRCKLNLINTLLY